MPGHKPFHPKVLLAPWMTVNGGVTVQMNEVPFDRDHSFLSLDVSTSGHPLSMEHRPASILPDVIIELPIICHLYLEHVLLNCLLALLAFTS
jgi:hypothetical protein